MKKGATLVVFTDSQYAIGQIEKVKTAEQIFTHKWRTKEIWDAIKTREQKGMKVVMQKVYSHYNVKMNKAREEEDKE